MDDELEAWIGDYVPKLLDGCWTVSGVSMSDDEFLQLLEGYAVARMVKLGVVDIDELKGEIVSETWIKIRNAKYLTRSYIWMAVGAALIDLLRRRKRPFEVPADWDSDEALPGDEPPAPAERVALEERDLAREYHEHLLPRLSRRQRQVAELWIPGYGNTEIAEMLGLTPNNVNQVVHNIRKELKQLRAELEG